VQVVRQSTGDTVTVIGAGVTLHEALKAADVLAEQGGLFFFLFFVLECIDHFFKLEPFLLSFLSLAFY